MGNTELRRSRKFPFTFSAMLYRTSSIFMHVGSQSCPKRMTTTRSSSDRMAWSTCHPLCKCGSMYDILTAGWGACGTTGMPMQLTARALPGPSRGAAGHRAPAPSSPPARPSRRGPSPAHPAGVLPSEAQRGSNAVMGGKRKGGRGKAHFRQGAGRDGRVPDGRRPRRRTVGHGLGRVTRVLPRRWDVEPCRGDL